MENKATMGLPSPGSTGVLSGSGSFSAMLQRTLGLPSGDLPIKVSGTPSSVVHTPAAVRPDSTRPTASPVINVVSTSSHLSSPLYSRDVSTTVGQHSESTNVSAGTYNHSEAGNNAGTSNHLEAAKVSPGSFNHLEAAKVSTGTPNHLEVTKVSPGTFNHLEGAKVSTGLGPLKRKRGRPRKYAPDGSMTLALIPVTTAPSFVSPSPVTTAPSSVSPSQKRGRGRPPGSGRKQLLEALGELMAGSAGSGFTPHAITVAAGEDVASKIMSFSQQGPRGVCILSANGAISNVTLRQPATSGGTVTYEGRFEILSLSGSFLLTESGGTRSRTGGLSVSLAGPDGRVIGGGVAGLLMAASPVQVVVGSFMSNTRKLQARPVTVGFSQIVSFGIPTAGIPTARASVNEVIDTKPAVPESPTLNQSTGAAGSSNSQPSQAADAIPIQSMYCSGSHGIPEARRNTDIDISL